MGGDAFEHIALVFTRDCAKRLVTLSNAQAVVDFSENVDTALRLIFLQTGILLRDREDLNMIPPEIARLQNCIDFKQESIDHARRLFILNFDPSGEDAFNKEICFSYACKMLNSIGPRSHHFSDSPTPSRIVNAELQLALHSPYVFGDEDLFCYEIMKKSSGETTENISDNDLLCHESM